MMSDVLIFMGSPRKKGNSEVLVDAVIRGIEEAGGTAETVRVADLGVAPCIGCGGCDKTGRCVVEDNMQPLYDKITSARRIILASPVYFYSITAQLKAMVDRCQALWNRKRLQTEAGPGLEHQDRKGYLLSVAATRGEKVFVGSVLVAKYFCDATGIEYAGELLVRGIDHRGAMAKDLASIENAVEFGRRCME
jgi:multimeric flavodoxin WrbA